MSHHYATTQPHNHTKVYAALTVILVLNFILGLFNTAQAQNQCVSLNANTHVNVSTTNNNSVCINLTGLNPNNTAIVVDPALNFYTSTKVGYTITLQLNNGGVIYSRNLYSAEDIDLAELPINGNTQITMILTKQQNGENYDYTFGVINSHEVAANHSVIAVNAWVKPLAVSNPAPSNPNPPNDPPPYGCGEWGCVDPLSAPNTIAQQPSSTTSLAHSLMPATQSTASHNSAPTMVASGISVDEAAQCNDGNRSKTPLPTHDISGEEFNLNEVLRGERAWSQKNFLLSSICPLCISAKKLRLINNHKTGGPYDVKNPDGTWQGTMEFGNYLYGAVMNVHGYTETQAQRFGAAYQAWADYKNSDGAISRPSALSQGYVNFITNTGDSEGDQELISLG